LFVIEGFISHLPMLSLSFVCTTDGTRGHVHEQRADTRLVSPLQPHKTDAKETEGRCVTRLRTMCAGRWQPAHRPISLHCRTLMSDAH
jgi:hypothetical protein